LSFIVTESFSGLTSTVVVVVGIVVVVEVVVEVDVVVVEVVVEVDVVVVEVVVVKIVVEVVIIVEVDDVVPIEAVSVTLTGLSITLLYDTPRNKNIPSIDVAINLFLLFIKIYRIVCSSSSSINSPISLSETTLSSSKCTGRFNSAYFFIKFPMIKIIAI